METKIFVYVEHENNKIKDVSFELLHKAQSLKASRPSLNSKVYAILLADEKTSLENEPMYYGADEVITFYHSSLGSFNTRNYAIVLSEIVKEYDPEIFLFGGTLLGRDLAPRLSAKLKTGLTADATSIVFNEEDEESKTLWITRPAFGGNLFATIVCENHRPQMATIRPNIFTMQERNEDVSVNITEFHKELPLLNDVKYIEVIKKESKQSDITKAKVILSAGRGIKKSLPLATEVADVLKGEIATSRALVDEGVMSKEIQVGQTGKTVRPNIYLACGISGAVQHTAGMNNSELIIAVNSDENAPIFDIADIGIIGDANLILKEIKTQLR